MKKILLLVMSMGVMVSAAYADDLSLNDKLASASHEDQVSNEQLDPNGLAATAAGNEDGDNGIIELTSLGEPDDGDGDTVSP